MAIGGSGRVVIEIDPELKRQLHAALKDEGSNLKQWFIKNVEFFLNNKIQPDLPFELSQSPQKDIHHEI